MGKQIHLEIEGMSCINCKIRIEKALKALPGVIKASVDYSAGTGDVEYNEERTTKKKIIKTIEALDYKVVSTGGAGVKKALVTVSLSLIIVGLYYLLQRFGILNRLVPTELADSSMGYGMLFVIGLITSVHCIAMCGGIGLSQSLAGISEEKSKKGGGHKAFMPSLIYNLGRVVSYTAVGFILGFVGMLIGGGTNTAMPVFVRGLVKIVAGLLMTVMGINTLGIFPALRKLSIHSPLVIQKAVAKKRTASGSRFVVGLLNGLMPCGPLQSMWIVALATGNPFAGALSMFLFSLGTVPLMLTLGSIVSLIGKKFAKPVMMAGGVMVAVMGLAMLTQGVVLPGWLSADVLLYLIIALFVIGVLISIMNKKNWMKIAVPAAAVVLAAVFVIWRSGEKQNIVTAPTEGNISAEDTAFTERYGSAEDSGQSADVQEVSSTLTLGTYPEITVRAGVPVKWTINAPEGSINGCNAVMLIQDYGIEHAFNVGENVIEFTPDKPGQVMYSCWMGMIYGRINVVE